jgi:hypothetical protein
MGLARRFINIAIGGCSKKKKGEHQNKTEGTSVINLILTLALGIGLLRAICFANCGLDSPNLGL